MLKDYRGVKIKTPHILKLDITLPMLHLPELRKIHKASFLPQSVYVTVSFFVMKPVLDIHNSFNM
jgi:hypothetical protein